MTLKTSNCGCWKKEHKEANNHCKIEYFSYLKSVGNADIIKDISATSHFESPSNEKVLSLISNFILK